MREGENRGKVDFLSVETFSPKIEPKSSKIFLDFLVISQFSIIINKNGRPKQLNSQTFQRKLQQAVVA